MFHAKQKISMTLSAVRCRSIGLIPVDNSLLWIFLGTADFVETDPEEKY